MHLIKFRENKSEIKQPSKDNILSTTETRKKRTFRELLFSIILSNLRVAIETRHPEG